MHIITVGSQIDAAGKPGIVFLAGQFHLKGKRQIILYVWIAQIFDISVCAGAAQSIEEHDLCRRFSVDLRYKMGVGRYPVSVQVDHHLNAWIFRQNRTHRLLRFAVCIASVQLTVYNIVNSGVMYCLDSFCIEQFCEICPHTHDTLRGSPGVESLNSS